MAITPVEGYIPNQEMQEVRTEEISIHVSPDESMTINVEVSEMQLASHQYYLQEAPTMLL